MTPIEVLMNGVSWTRVEAPPTERIEDATLLPYVTHTGVLELDGIKIGCIQLSDGRRLITEDGIKSFLRHLTGEIGRT